MATNDSDSGAGAGGWITAGVLLIGVILVALFVWPGYGRGTTNTPAPTQVNVQIPTPEIPTHAPAAEPAP
jgi:hypothetical protein